MRPEEDPLLRLRTESRHGVHEPDLLAEIRRIVGEGIRLDDRRELAQAAHEIRKAGIVRRCARHPRAKRALALQRREGLPPVEGCRRGLVPTGWSENREERCRVQAALRSGTAR